MRCLSARLPYARDGGRLTFGIRRGCHKRMCLPGRSAPSGFPISPHNTGSKDGFAPWCPLWAGAHSCRPSQILVGREMVEALLQGRERQNEVPGSAGRRSSERSRKRRANSKITTKSEEFLTMRGGNGLVTGVGLKEKTAGQSPARLHTRLRCSPSICARTFLPASGPRCRCNHRLARRACCRGDDEGVQHIAAMFPSRR